MYTLSDQKIRLVATADLVFMLRLILPSEIDYGYREINEQVKAVNHLAKLCVWDMTQCIPSHMSLDPTARIVVKDLDKFWQKTINQSKKAKRIDIHVASIVEAADIYLRDAIVICTDFPLHHYRELDNEVIKLLDYLYIFGEDEILEQGMHLYLKSYKIIKKYW